MSSTSSVVSALSSADEPVPDANLGLNTQNPQDDDAPAGQEVVDLTTGAVQQKTKKGRWYYFGKFVAIAFAIGCGATTVAALVTTMTVIAPAFLINPGFYVLAISLFGATSFANYRMTRDSVPQIFMNGIKSLFTRKNENGVDEPLTGRRKALVIVGFVLSLALGLAIGALTTSCVWALPLAFGFLTVISAAFPPLAIFLGAVTAICLTVVMVNAFAELAKSKDIIGSAKRTLKAIFLPHPVNDAGKSTARFLCERVPVWIAILAIAAVSLGLAFWGETYTLQSCATGLSALTAKLFHGTSTAINVMNIVITRGLALAAQIPFTIKTTLNPFVRLCYKIFGIETESDASSTIKQQASSTLERIEPYVGAIASIENAGGNGLVALSGKAIDIWSLIGTIGATLNSFFSTFGSTLSSSLPKEHPVPVRRGSSTADITGRIGGSGSGGNSPSHSPANDAHLNEDNDNDGGGDLDIIPEPTREIANITIAPAF